MRSVTEEAFETLYSPHICACIHEYVQSNSVQNFEIPSQLSAEGNAKINRDMSITRRTRLVHFGVKFPDNLSA